MSYKKYLEMICEGDITSVRAKMQAKQRGLTHQSHNIWKDKFGQDFKWDEQGKKFEKVDKKAQLLDLNLADKKAGKKADDMGLSGRKKLKFITKETHKELKTVFPGFMRGL